VLRALEKEVKELDEKILPSDVNMLTVYDRQNLINFCLHTVFHNVLEGIFLVTLIVFLFMRDWRATLDCFPDYSTFPSFCVHHAICKRQCLPILFSIGRN
jgi:hypothetical protein